MRNLILTAILLLTSTFCFSQEPLSVGEKIAGDFNGDGKTDTAFLKVIRHSTTKALRWTLGFSDKRIPPLQLGCCDVTLVNEGDLTGDQSAEISVFQKPENGCAYLWTTYSLKLGGWTKLVNPFLIATDCEDFKPADLQNRVFRENGNVYYWDVDPNDEESKPVKKQVMFW